MANVSPGNLLACYCGAACGPQDALFLFTFQRGGRGRQLNISGGYVVSRAIPSLKMEKGPQEIQALLYPCHHSFLSLQVPLKPLAGPTPPLPLCWGLLLPLPPAPQRSSCQLHQARQGATVLGSAGGNMPCPGCCWKAGPHSPHPQWISLPGHPQSMAFEEKQCAFSWFSCGSPG